MIIYYFYRVARSKQMNQYDAYLTRKANEVVGELQRSYEMLQPAQLHYELVLHYAMVSIYSPQQMDIQLNAIADSWRKTKVQAELYSNYLQTVHFPDAQEYFALINICCAGHMIPLQFQQLLIDKALSYDITETARLLLLKLFTQNYNRDIFEPYLVRRLEMLNDKQFVRKEREIVPYLLFLSAIRDHDTIFSLANGKLDKFRRHVSRNFLLNAIAHGIYGERLSTIARYVSQNLPLLQAILLDKKHSHCAFSCLTEYAIAQRQFLNTYAFSALLKSMKEIPSIAICYISRLTCSICYGYDIFAENPQQNYQKIQNEQFYEVFVDMYLLLNKVFNNTILKLGDYFLLGDLFTCREKYFYLLPYYQMMASESYYVTDFTIFLIGQVIAYNPQYYLRILPKGKLLDLVLLAVPNQDMAIESKLVINQNIVLPLLMRKTKIQKYEKQFISLLQNDLSNIYLKDLKVFLCNMSQICGQAEVQAVLAIVLQKIKHYRFFGEAIDMLASFAFVPSNMNFLFSVIMLLLTIYSTNQSKIESVLTRILQQINFFTTPKTKYQVLRDVLESASQTNQAFYQFVQRQLLLDDKQHSQNIRSTVLLYYFYDASFLKEMVKYQLILDPTLLEITHFITNYALPFSLPEQQLFRVGSESDTSMVASQSITIDYCGKSQGCVLLQYFDECENSRDTEEKFAYYWALWFTHSPDLYKTNSYFKKQRADPKADYTAQLLTLITSPIYRKVLGRIFALLEASAQSRDLSGPEYNMVLVMCFPFFVILNALRNIQNVADACINKAPDSTPSRTLCGLCSQANPPVAEYLSSAIQFLTSDKLNEALRRPTAQDKFSFIEIVSFTQFAIFSHNFSVQCYNSVYSSSSNATYRLRALGKVFYASFYQNCQLSSFIACDAAYQVKNAIPKYYSYILQLIVSTIRTNAQLADIMSFYISVKAAGTRDAATQLGEKELEALDTLNDVIERKALQIMVKYDCSIRLNLYALDNAIPNKEYVVLYYEDARSMLEPLRERDDEIGAYMWYQIVKYDISKQVEFQFNSRIDYAQSQQYFTIAQLFILLHYLQRFPECQKMCASTMQLLLTEDRIAATWTKSIYQYVEREQLLYFASLEKIILFIPGFFYAYLEALRPDLPLDHHIEEQIVQFSSSFVANSFVLSNTAPKISPGSEFSSFETYSDNDSASSVSSASSSVLLLTTADERTHLSEAFLKFFFYFVAMSKSKKVSDILVDYFSAKYDDIFIVKLIQFICNNRYFLEHYKIEQANVTSHEKKIKIVSKPPMRAQQDKATNSTVFYKSQFDTQVQTQAKRSKFMIGNIQEMSIRQFDFNVMEQLIVDVAQRKLVDVLTYLQQFTLNGSVPYNLYDYKFLQLYLVDAQRREYIYGFEARNILVKVLRRCLEEKLEVPEQELYNSLYVLLTDGYFVDCSKEVRRQRVQDSVSSTYKGEPSAYAPSSKHSDSFYYSTAYYQVALNIRENYYMEKLLGALVNYLITAHKFQDDEEKKQAVMYLYCKHLSQFHTFNTVRFCVYLALRVKYFGILHNEYILFPWIGAEQYYEYCASKDLGASQYMANMMPLQHDKHFAIGMSNRKKLLFVIMTLVQQEKACLQKYAPEDVHWLLIYMFSNYCNQNLLLAYTNDARLHQQKALIERCVLMLLDSTISSGNEARLNAFAYFIRIGKLNTHSQRFAWQLFQTIISGVPAETLERFSFFQTQAIGDFSKHVQFCQQQVFFTTAKFSASQLAGTQTLIIERVYQKCREWLDTNLKNGNQQRQLSRSPGGDFYRRCVHMFLSELYYHSGVYISEQNITQQYSLPSMSSPAINFAIAKEKLELHEFLALIVAYVLNIFLVKFVHPQALISDMAVPIAYTIRYVQKNYPGEQEANFQLLNNWICYFYNMEYGIMNYPEPNMKPFSVGYLAQFIKDKTRFLAKLAVVVQCPFLELPALLLMAEVASQLCKQNQQAELEGINFGLYPASEYHSRLIYYQLVSRYNYRSQFDASSAIANRYEYLQAFRRYFGGENKY